MASRKKAKKKRKSNKANAKKRKNLWFYPLLTLFFVSIIALAFYVMLLDERVRTEFEGKRWTLPARVYAQAVELYLGQNISIGQIRTELEALGFIKRTGLSAAGQYQQINSSTIQFFSRNFEFWDSKEPSKKVGIRIEGGQITAITDLNEQKIIPFFRLEPRLIGKIYPEHNEDRILVPYKDVPPALVEALVAIEDRNFYKHFGVDPKGILRAMWANLKKVSFSQGGSTLTQQLVKNFYLSHEKTLKRKFNEFLMALILEYHYSKREILSAYINEVYLGQDGARAIHGFGTAAEFYFSKPLQELDVSQLALLVGMVKGASYYNPRNHPERALNRRNLVLNEMHKLNSLDKEQLTTASAKPLLIRAKPDWSGRQYKGFIELLRKQLREYYNSEELRTEGLRIFTTLKAEYQKQAQLVVEKRLAQLEKARKLEKNSLQSAVIITSTDTGEVLAVVAGRNTAEAGFNRAVAARRPIGSLIKPAIYLTAMSKAKRYSPLSLLKDEEINLKQDNGEVWQPNNYDNQTHGDVPAYLALAKSYNLATVSLGMELGLGTVVKTIKKLGINQSIPEYPSILLGAVELTPLEVTQMYQTLASSGFYVPLNTIREILDKNGKPLQRKELKVSKTLDDRAVYILHAMLTEVFKQGTAAGLNTRLAAKLPLAGKTGTTNDLRDSWFAAYGSNLLAVAWVGRDDNENAGLTGASGAMQIWGDIMEQLPIEPLNLVTPEGVVWKRVPSWTEGCDNSFRLPFMASALPDQQEFCQ